MAKAKKKLTRAEKGELTRRNLLEAAVEVVGERGYGDASVTSITTRANIAQGTFYNYFESKQDILDQLLPELGEVLLHYLGDQVGSATYLEREELSLRAYFDFIRQHPAFYRILLEAQVYSPDSYTRHARNLTRNYITALRKNKSNGQLGMYSEEEFETLAIMLLGARVQLMGHYCFRDGHVRAIPEHVIGTFIKFLESGFGGPGPRRRPATTPAAGPRSWFDGEMLAITESTLEVRYEIDPSSRHLATDSPDRALQELVADLLGRTAESLQPAGTRIRSNSTLLFAQELPLTIHASCRLESTELGEAVAEFVLSSAARPSAGRLASGQAVFGSRHLPT